MALSNIKTLKSPPGKPPASLSAPAAEWWRALVRDFGIHDAAGTLLLESALLAWDRQKQAEALIARDGPVILTKDKGLKSHPAVIIERDARAAFMAGMKALNLDLEPLRDGPGRPPGAY